MARLVPAIHVFPWEKANTRMPGIKPGMTESIPKPDLLRRLCARRGRFSGSLRSLFGLRLFIDHAHRPDRALVENEQRDRKRHLADDVGRRENRRQHESADDEI